MICMIGLTPVSLLSHNILAESLEDPSEELQLYISEYPPFCFTENNESKGLAVDVVREIMNDLQVDFPIRSVPWKRALMNISGEQSAGLFTITRTVKRDPQFKWVGPIAVSNLVFFARHDSEIKINDLADARQVGRVGTAQGYSAERYLLGQGFKNLVSNAGSDKTNPTKLVKGYLDLWVSVDVVGYYLAAQERVKARELKIVYEISQQPKYIAFSLATPDELVMSWQSALDHMKADGRMGLIKQRWMSR